MVLYQLPKLHSSIKLNMWDVQRVLATALIALVLGVHDSGCQQSITSIWSGVPGGVDLTFQVYRNWANSLNTKGTEYLVVYPRSSKQATTIVSWAHSVGRNVRVQGHRHSQSPITVSNGDDKSRIVILDFTRHMNKLRVGPQKTEVVLGKPTILKSVVAETGASMEALFTFAEQNGLGLVMAPIIGADATVGGVLAIAGHGAGARAINEPLSQAGFTFGSVSNTIMELTAVVWDNSKGKYVLKRFSRKDPDIGAFMVHLGRAVITEVTILMGDNYNMRCVSYTDVPAWDLFAHPNNSTGLRTYAKYADDVGRVDVIWYPFTKTPWLKLWTVESRKPKESRFINEPYNYQFRSTLDNPQIPGTVYGPQAHANLVKGLTDTKTWDIWGPSKNTILHYNRTSTPLVYSGFVVLTSRANVQLVFNDMMKFYVNLLDEYASRGIYPIDQYIKVRATGLDDSRDTGIAGAVEPTLSPLRPVKTRPDFDIGLWMNTLTTTERPYSDEFMRRFEDFAYSRFNGGDAIVRPEWSKNWGHSDKAPHDNPIFLKDTIPRMFGIEEWNWAVNTLNKYDPNQVISNKFLREFLVPYHGPMQRIPSVGNVRQPFPEQGLGWRNSGLTF